MAKKQDKAILIIIIILVLLYNHNNTEYDEERHTCQKITYSWSFTEPRAEYINFTSGDAIYCQEGVCGRMPLVKVVCNEWTVKNKILDD